MGKALDSFAARRPLEGAPGIDFIDIGAACAIEGAQIDRLPASLKVLLENLLRHENGTSVTREDIAALARWPATRRSEREVAFHPARIVMPDSSGTPLLADLSAMRDAVGAAGGDPQRVNPVIPVDVVLDHSVVAEHAGTRDAFRRNIALEFDQNRERYTFLRWAQGAYDNLRIVPPGSGIVHQVNLEYLASPVRTESVGGRRLVFPDTLVGMDSHTTMVNALAVLGWGVGGIEAASAMLGEPISMLIPDVVGCRLVGRLREGVTSTDLVLTVVQQLRAMGVVGKLVEFCGPGLAGLTLPDRATLANMAPEYGATMGFFPVDGETLRYLAETGRDPAEVMLAERYARAQGLWANENEAAYTDVLVIDLGAVETSLAGPRRPQDRVGLASVAQSFIDACPEASRSSSGDLHDPERGLRHGDVVIAAITSCTNTANPGVMLRAGLLASKARDYGLTVKPWVKTTLSPGSRVVTDYLELAGLQGDLDALGFNLAGYGCMTCGGGSGSLSPSIAGAIADREISVATVLSGNRNFEGRIHPAAKANYLASPPLVVAYALAGTVLIDLRTQPLGLTRDGTPVFLADIWPSDNEVQAMVAQALSPSLFVERYRSIFDGGEEWQSLATMDRPTFSWEASSTYLRRPPFFDRSDDAARRTAIRGARPLAIFGDSVTTDHISPAGAIPPNSPAGCYLIASGVAPTDFNSYIARRGNHEVMIRGTFANTRIVNAMVPGRRGGITRHEPSGEEMTIFEAVIRYAAEDVPLVVIAGAEYGTGSSRDWAAKGTALLGVRAVIAESFERIHRSNLVGMGVLPLEFTGSDSRATLKLDGRETIDIADMTGEPRSMVRALITRPDASRLEIDLRVRIDTQSEAEWFASGGILPFIARKLMRDGKGTSLKANGAR
ncbi:aconitate hydratase AcnA [Methylobacterium aquaticum]|uniref:aconitate hydratase AcnA n=1 Tax=Methylobacterium aquaticum TaxID=270351 RepID=UPI003D16F11B